MWIVFLSPSERHSAWLTKTSALNQARVLKEHGYKRPYVNFDETVSCEDGHYYV